MANGNGEADIYMSEVQFVEVNNFIYLGATFFKDGSYMAEIRIRIASVTTVMSRQERTWGRLRTVPDPRSNPAVRTVCFRLFVVSVPCLSNVFQQSIHLSTPSSTRPIIHVYPFVHLSTHPSRYSL